MTWVVGHPTLRSCIGLADIQVTITKSDGSKIYDDCIQKIFPLCRDISVGFSGSVKLGFGLIRDAHKYFGFPNSGREWSPYIAVHKWRRRLRWVYRRLSPELAKPVQFLVLGVSPMDTPFPKTSGWILKSPDFVAKRIPYGRVGSIGSGNNIQSYIDILTERNNQSWDEYFDSNGLLRAELAMPGGFGAMLGVEIAMAATSIGAPGISRHFHLCLVKRGEISIWPNDYGELPSGGKPIEVKMPPTVAGWADFVEYMRNKGVTVDAGNAIASDRR